MTAQTNIKAEEGRLQAHAFESCQRHSVARWPLPGVEVVESCTLAAEMSLTQNIQAGVCPIKSCNLHFLLV